MIKALIFDLDGTIAQTEELHRAAFNKTLKPLHIAIPRKDWYTKYVGTGSRTIMTDVFRKNQIKQDIKPWIEHKKKLFDKLAETTKIKTYSGFFQLLKYAKKAGLRVIIASGGYKSNVYITMKRIGVGNLPFVSNDDVRHRKPAPDIFLLAAKKLRVKPSECMVFEDSFAGAKGAKNAKMKCIAVLNTTARSRLKKAGADMIVKSLNEVDLKKLLNI